jgi:hypothetical protein
MLIHYAKSTVVVTPHVFWRENRERSGKSKFELLHYSSRDRKELAERLENAIRSFSFSILELEFEAAVVKHGNGDETTCRREDNVRGSRPRKGHHLGG